MTKNKTRKFRPVYPDRDEVNSLIARMRTKRASVADMERACTILRQAGISSPSKALMANQAYDRAVAGDR